MGNRNDNHDDKPWEKKFEDGKDENGDSNSPQQMGRIVAFGFLLRDCSNDRTVFHIIKNCGTTHK